MSRWWTGVEESTGRTGVFPYNFVKEVSLQPGTSQSMSSPESSSKKLISSKSGTIKPLRSAMSASDANTLIDEAAIVKKPDNGSKIQRSESANALQGHPASNDMQRSQSSSRLEKTDLQALANLPDNTLVTVKLLKQCVAELRSEFQRQLDTRK